MNVLIIDDQKNVVSGMKKGIDWGKMQVDQVWEAYNAEEAKEIICKKQVDIMLCDIEMPGDDGLSLYRWVKEYDSRIECIFLTAHADFQFAKEALRLGSFDYILQPAPYEEIEAALLKVREKILSRTKQQRYSSYGKDFYENRDLLLDGFLQGWLGGNEADLDRIRRKLRQFQIDLSENARVAYCIFQVLGWEKEEDRLESGLFRYAVSNILEELFDDSGIKILNVAVGKETYALLFYQNEGEELSRDETRGLLEGFLKQSKAYYGSIAACYLGDFGSIRELDGQIHQVRELQKDNVARQSGVFVVKRTPDRELSGLTEMEDWILELSGGKAREVKEKALRYLDREMNAEALKRFYMKFMQVTAMACERLSISSYQIFEGKENSEKSLVAYQTIEGMKQMVCMVTEYFLSYTEEEYNYVETVIQYIHCNMEKDIRRSELAQMVNLNEDYLSRLFKKEKGISLKEYILLEKMRTAQNLLRNTTFSVGMIGAKVGFDNFSHFSQMYKKVMGRTPVEEREEAGWEQDKK